VVLSFGVLVNDLLVDARTYASLDIPALQALLAASALGARVTVVGAATEDGWERRWQDAQRVCFFNAVSEADTATLITVLLETYARMDPAQFADLQITVLSIDVLSSTLK
jgi:hypothetical protein